MSPTTNPAYVTLIGGANMDIAVHSHARLVAGDSNPGRIACSPGGVARNVAENLVRLGVDARLLSVLGDDVFGLALRQAAADVGLDMRACATLPGRRTATYVSLHGADGDMGVAVNDMDILDCLTPEWLHAQAALLHGATAVAVDCNVRPDVLAWLCGVTPQAAAVEGAALPAPPAITALFAEAVSVAKCHKLLPVLPHIHTLKANHLEAQALTGFAIHTVPAAMDAARSLHQHGVRNVVVSLGADGVAWCDASGTTGHQGVRPVRMASATGAGDALLAGLLVGHVQHIPLQQAVRFAMACAEITVSSTLANSPDLNMAAIRARLEQNT